MQDTQVEGVTEPENPTCEAIMYSTRWREQHTAGDRAFAAHELPAARAAFEAALATAALLLDRWPLLGLSLRALSCPRLADVMRQQGRADEARELAWQWLDQVLCLAESSQAPADQRLACIGHVDAALKHVLAEQAQPPHPDHRAGRIPLVLRRIQRAHDAAGRAHRGEPPLS